MNSVTPLKNETDQQKRVQVVFNGKLLPGMNKEQVLPRLAKLLKTDAEIVEPLFNGESWLIRDNIAPETGRKFEQAFRRSGALCRLIAGDEKEKEADDPLFPNPPLSVDLYPFSPAVFAYPKNLALNDCRNTPVAYLSSGKPIAGKYLAFLIALVTALIIQWPLTFHFAEKLPTSTTIYLSTGIYLALFFLVSTGVKGRRKCHLSTSQNKKSRFLLLAEKSWISFRNNSFTVFDGNGNSLGTVKQDRLLKRWEALDKNGCRIAFAEKKRPGGSNIMEDAVEARDEYIDLSFWDQIQQIQTIRSFFFPGKSEKYLVGIYDDEGKNLGTCNTKDDLLIDLKTSSSGDPDPRLLLSLCLLVGGL